MLCTDPVLGGHKDPLCFAAMVAKALLELLLVSVEDSARPAYKREGEVSWSFMQFFIKGNINIEQL